MAPKNRFLSFLILSLAISVSSAIDTISTNQSLSGDQLLISKGGKFTLGFFPTGTGSSSKRFYVGIYYSKSKVSVLTPVWVANRATPVSDPATSLLHIVQDGNLVLLDQSDKSLVWSTNITTISSSTSVAAVLLDTGNLVLTDAYNSSKVLWQSIDNPTDTWLPGGKLVLDKVTGVSQKLFSWKNMYDPAPGIFSLEIDPAGTTQYLIQWNNSKSYWNSGSWNGHIFSGVPEMMAEMTARSIYSFQFVNDTDQQYFTYSVKDDSSIITRSIMDYTGQMKMLAWAPLSQEWILFWSQPSTHCQVYAICGPFGSCNERTGRFCDCLKGFRQRSPETWALGDQSGGCVRNTPMQCGNNSSGNAQQDKFFQMTSVRLPDNPQTLQVSSVSDCEQACLNNCSCTAYSYETSCSLWHGDLLNLQDGYGGSGGGTLYLRLAASELPSHKSNKGMIAGVVAGAVAVLLASVAIVWFLMWRRRRMGLINASKATEGTLVAFRYSDLQRVTKNFSDRLGGGAFGSVFKGVLPDSVVVAVKKLEGLQQGEKQFRTEVSTIGSVQHVNLVRFRGFCSQGTRKLLVYDYMPNGSLDTQLFQDTPKVLNWGTRYQIALGTARGLTYLHEKCRYCIIHCDIKPENILLDHSFVPKVADFGLAKLVGRDFSRVLTTMRGTRGYLAPEWISGLAITAKADVFSYGMMLFEIISGRRNSDQTGEGHAAFFPTMATKKLMEGQVLSLLDARLGGDANEEEVARVCKVACWCIQDDEKCRPTMGQVVQILEGVIQVDMPTIPRSLQIFGQNHEEIIFFSDFSSPPSSKGKLPLPVVPKRKSSSFLSSRTSS